MVDVEEYDGIILRDGRPGHVVEIFSEEIHGRKAYLIDLPLNDPEFQVVVAPWEVVSRLPPSDSRVWSCYDRWRQKTGTEEIFFEAEDVKQILQEHHIPKSDYAINDSLAKIGERAIILECDTDCGLYRYSVIKNDCLIKTARFTGPTEACWMFLIEMMEWYPSLREYLS